MEEKILVDEPTEVIKINWDGAKFAIVRVRDRMTTTIIFNAKEMLELIKFAASLGRIAIDNDKE